MPLVSRPSRGHMEDSMLIITDLARTKILGLIKAEQQECLALRVAISGRGPGGFQHELQFLGPEERTAGDVVTDDGGVEVVADEASAVNLKGTTIDDLEGTHQSGFKIANPNSLWSEPTALAVESVIDGQINPGVSGHGGYVTLLDVKDGTAYIPRLAPASGTRSNTDCSRTSQ